MDTIPQQSLSYWMDSTSFQSYPRIEEDISADVVVIGGGITGITTCYLLQKEGINAILIDTNLVAQGTTGHTTAKVSIQHNLIYNKLIKDLGIESAKDYAESNTYGLELIRKIIAENKINCDLSQEISYVYTQSDEYIKDIEEEFKAIERLGLQGSFLNKLPLPFDIKAAVSIENQSQFHPLKYLNSLCKVINSKGNCIYENTTAVDIHTEKNSIKKLIVSLKNGAKIHCDHAVIASYFPFYDGLGMYSFRMYAEKSYVLAVKTKGEYQGGMYINAEDPTRSIRSTTINGEKIVLFGGENHRSGHDPNTLIHYNNLLSFAQNTYGVQKTLYRWSTQDLITLDNVPYIGNITDHHENIYVATGFGKWGMTTSAVAGTLIKDKIIKKQNAWEELYKPSRFNVDPSLKNVASEGMHVLTHFVMGKLQPAGDTIDNLLNGQGKVLTINGKKVGAYKDYNGKIHLVDTTCTHLKCEVQWNNAEKSWDCPCHGSRFSAYGEVIEGPAILPLRTLNLEEL